jgi:hypothetical protein
MNKFGPEKKNGNFYGVPVVYGEVTLELVRFKGN